MLCVKHNGLLETESTVQANGAAMLCVIYVHRELSSPLRGLYRIVTYSSAKKE
jgi:hypothetical protein